MLTTGQRMYVYLRGKTTGGVTPAQRRRLVHKHRARGGKISHYGRNWQAWPEDFDLPDRTPKWEQRSSERLARARARWQLPRCVYCSDPRMLDPDECTCIYPCDAGEWCWWAGRVFPSVQADVWPEGDKYPQSQPEGYERTPAAAGNPPGNRGDREAHERENQ